MLFCWVYDAFSSLGSVILGDTVVDILICIVKAALSSGSLDGSTLMGQITKGRRREFVYFV